MARARVVNQHAAKLGAPDRDLGLSIERTMGLPKHAPLGAHTSKRPSAHGNFARPLTSSSTDPRYTVMLYLAVQLYTYVVLAAVILSWVRLEPSNPLVRGVNALTEPVLKPIRAVLPTFMGLDFSPLVLLLALSLIQRFL